jgi:hypothetical protein
MEVIINLPVNSEIPNELSFFTPNDMLMMLLIGIRGVIVMKEQYISEDSCDIKNELEIKLLKKEDEKLIIKDIYNDLLMNERERHNKLIENQINIENDKYRILIANYDKENIRNEDKINQLNLELNLIEKEVIIKDELIKHQNLMNGLRIENEVNSRVKKREDEMNKELVDNRELLNKTDRILLINENIQKHQDNEKIQNLQTELANTKEQLNKIIIENEMKMNRQLNATIENNNKTLEEISKSTNKSNVRGAAGENYFKNLALKTFCDNSNFEIIDKSKTPHCGDFWLSFEKFTIMVDTKNYVDTPVPARDRLKLRNDLQSNQHIKIAWLVAMDQPILTFSSFPFMIDIDDGMCIFYINSLMYSDNPGSLLRQVWYASNFIYDNLLNIDSGINILGKYQKNEIRVRNLLNKMRVQSKERFATLNQLTENFKATDADIMDCLNEEIRDVRENHIEIVSRWWSENLIRAQGSKVKSNDLHKIFISDHDNRKYSIDMDMFKNILRSMEILKEEEIERGKTDKAQYTIIGYKIIKSSK